MMKKLGVFLLIGFFSVLSCKSGNMVSNVKKGHFEQAPKMTLGELVNRYQFIDAAAIRWTSVTDANKNEFAEFSVSVDTSLDILFHSLQEKINKGQRTELRFFWHSFFEDLLTTENFRSDAISLGLLTARVWNYRPNYDSWSPDFFNCDACALTMRFSIDNNKVVTTQAASLTFSITSPLEGNDVKYELIYNISAENAEKMLLDNVDIGNASELF